MVSDWAFRERASTAAGSTNRERHGVFCNMAAKDHRPFRPPNTQIVVF